MSEWWAVFVGLLMLAWVVVIIWNTKGSDR